MYYYHALIRTHHIASRRKVAVLRTAAKKLQCRVLLRSGAVPPGVMYVQGPTRTAVQCWVDTVRGLRYKDYQLVAAVRSSEEDAVSGEELGRPGVLQEVDRVKDMAARLAPHPKLLDWWRRAMGFT